MQWFHFAQTEFLWLLLALPIWWGVKASQRLRQRGGNEAVAYADSHLMPYLTLNQSAAADAQKHYWPWALQAAFLFAVIALAGPRWDFQEQQVLTPDAAVMLVVDVSHSMRVDDVAPDRSARARQEILEFLEAAEPKGIRVGLVAFAAQAHLVSPLTEDVDIVREFVPALTPDLVKIQGSDPYQAIEFAASQLERYAEITGGESRHIMLVTDGEVHDAEALESQARAMSRLDPPMQLHLFTFATEEGGPVHNGTGAWLSDLNSGQPHISKLQPERMQRIAEAGLGHWIRASWLKDDTEQLIQLLSPDSGQVTQGRMERLWRERFGIPLAVGMLLLLIASRRAGIVILALCLPLSTASAQEPLRKEIEAIQSFHDGEFGEAAEHFHHPYRKGVAYYRAGKYDKASQSFAAAIKAEKAQESPDVELLSGAWHNLGNSLFHLRDYEKSLKAYEKALEVNEDHAPAEVNRDLLRQLLNKPPQSSAQPEANRDADEQAQPDQQQGASDGQSDQQSQGGQGEQPQDESSQGEQEGNEQGDQDSEDGEQQDQSGDGSSDENQSGEQDDGQADGEAEQDGEENQQDGSSGQGEQEEGESDGSSPEEQEGDNQSNPMTDRLLDQLSGDASDLLERRIDAMEDQKRGRNVPRDIQPW